MARGGRTRGLVYLSRIWKVKNYTLKTSYKLKIGRRLEGRQRTRRTLLYGILYAGTCIYHVYVYSKYYRYIVLLSFINGGTLYFAKQSEYVVRRIGQWRTQRKRKTVYVLIDSVGEKTKCDATGLEKARTGELYKYRERRWENVKTELVLENDISRMISPYDAEYKI